MSKRGHMWQRHRGEVGTGACMKCRTPTDGHVMCLFHRTEHQRHQESRRYSARAAGQCQECGAPSPDRVRCDDCTDRRATRPHRQTTYRRRREEGGDLYRKLRRMRGAV